MSKSLKEYEEEWKKLDTYGIMDKEDDMKWN